MADKFAKSIHYRSKEIGIRVEMVETVDVSFFQ